MTAAADTQARVAIVLPTYNGEKHLAAQLDSLLTQDYPDFVIVARDDGSTDSSEKILHVYAQQNPERIRVLPSESENRGACGSFSVLFEYVLAHKETLGLSSAYVMCCDQDDVWYPDKIRRSMDAMRELEAAHPHRACLVHSDLRVVDENGQVLADSFFQYQDIRPHKRRFARMLVSNSVTGCTALCNEKLVQMSSPVPDGAVMHDWWLALVVSAFGAIHTIEAPLLDYRQHGANTLGAREYRRSALTPAKFGRLFDPGYDAVTQQLTRQAEAFAGVYSQRLSNGRVLVLAMALGMGSRFRLWRNVVFRALMAFGR
ncbi:MAG: glycosyltransferase family 2 protein [Gammaproteobacteria bacterium]|nr:glycosyltransferase family 2 protein [Pseudomonadales bacterium]MCP5329364.1 glycosyltransferase family 2 protein [Pseudomonadales bacterium]